MYSSIVHDTVLLLDTEALSNVRYLYMDVPVIIYCSYPPWIFYFVLSYTFKMNIYTKDIGELQLFVWS